MPSIFDAAGFSSSLFFPRRDLSRPPAGAEDHEVVARDGARLHVRIHGLTRATAALVHFHGNGEVVESWDPLGLLLAAQGVALALVEYRGYGMSSDDAPSARACLQDAADSIEPLRALLRRDGTPLPIVVMGRSLGGFVVSSLMARLPRFACGWILESAATDLDGLVRRRGFDPSAISEDDRALFDPARHLPLARAPLLILHGTQDTLVPPSNAELALRMAGSTSRRIAWIEGRGHNDLHAAPSVVPTILDFVRSCARGADRRAGSLLCQGLGDAIGFLVEGEHPALCSFFVQQTFARMEPPDRTRGPFSFGQYSDDTQLARELARSLAARAVWVPEDLAKRIARIFEEERIVGRGKATENAAKRLQRGVPWDQAGEPPPRAGNGGAMRAGPVGLALREVGLRRQVADEQARITHADPRARGAAVLVAEVVAGALEDQDPCSAEHLNALAEAVSSLDPVLAGALGQVPRWVAMEAEAAMAEIARVGMEDESKLAGSRWHGISPMATCSALAAFVAYARSPLDAEQALGTAIAAGGDTDTVAAMTGAMVGARVGLTGLTTRLRRWASLLQDQGTDGPEELIALAHTTAS
ncbi:MAG: ADP-ribosylglycohydrolase family protein [Polyangiaceae bacterium]|jgi:ADP-ribosylglycohydrolase/dienelactone hydrolase|nr:ADP-ribosylglycohydrolase family protein [Polyangiaceae bacterium]